MIWKAICVHIRLIECGLPARVISLSEAAHRAVCEQAAISAAITATAVKPEHNILRRNICKNLA